MHATHYLLYLYWIEILHWILDQNV